MKSHNLFNRGQSYKTILIQALSVCTRFSLFAFVCGELTIKDGFAKESRGKILFYQLSPCGVPLIDTFWVLWCINHIKVFFGMVHVQDWHQKFKIQYHVLPSEFV